MQPILTDRTITVSGFQLPQLEDLQKPPQIYKHLQKKKTVNGFIRK